MTKTASRQRALPPSRSVVSMGGREDALAAAQEYHTGFRALDSARIWRRQGGGIEGTGDDRRDSHGQADDRRRDVLPNRGDRRHKLHRRGLLPLVRFRSDAAASVMARAAILHPGAR